MPDIAAVDQQFAWNGSSMSTGVTGGGFSALWAEPSWQQAAAAPTQASAAAADELSCPAAASGGYCRGVPDVSADADPYSGYIIYLTQNVTNPQTNTTSPELTATPWGGTSAAAPLWAALTALINASPACNGHNLGPLNPLLYQIAVKGMPGLTNITSGNNDDTADNPTAYFTAGRGFSPVTGLGTPDGAPLARSLCAQADTLTLNAPASESSSYGQPVHFTSVSASDAQGHALTYSATGLPPGLAIDPQSGSITGTPTANANASARITVTAADNGATQTRIISWTVTGAPATTSTAPSAPTTNPTTGGDHGGGGGTTKRPPVHVVHMTRRFHAQTIRIAFTITTNRGSQRLVVRYSTHAAGAKRRLNGVELVLRPRAGNAKRQNRTLRLAVLRRGHAARGRLAVSLRPAQVRRGLALALRYSAGPLHLIVLPHL